jgi:hypothetical protein
MRWLAWVWWYCYFVFLGLDYIKTEAAAVNTKPAISPRDHFLLSHATFKATFTEIFHHDLYPAFSHSLHWFWFCSNMLRDSRSQSQCRCKQPNEPQRKTVTGTHIIPERLPSSWPLTSVPKTHVQRAMLFAVTTTSASSAYPSYRDRMSLSNEMTLLETTQTGGSYCLKPARFGL